MKFYITCKECGEEVKVDLGGGKQAERKYEWIKDDYVCDSCKAKAREAAKKAEQEDKLENGGYKQITVHYSEYKNNYQGFYNNKGQKVEAGEYHADDKTIDLLVPEGKLVKLSDKELFDLTNNRPNVFENETEEDLEEKRVAVLARFEEDEEEIEEVKPAKKNTWHRIQFLNPCFVLARTDSSVLIQMPSSTEFEGYKFWHPRKCFNEYVSGDITLTFSDSWIFKLEANGGALKEELTAESFLKATDNGNEFHKYEKVDRTYTPKKLDPVENAEAIPELIDDEQ